MKINEKRTIQISKYLSLVLRHKPEQLGIELDINGWTSVSTLLDKMNAKGKTIDLEELKHVVETNSKKRFKFSDDFLRIRANQGHSINIELGYEPKTPPEKLYHGTAERNLESIFESGLSKRNRHNVHLSKEIETAINVGSRHGKPIVLSIDSIGMNKDGFTFYQSENGVWLTEVVPTKYLSNNKKLNFK